MAVFRSQPQRRSTKALLILTSGLMAIGIAGCGPEVKKDTRVFAKVSGKVTVDGTAIKGEGIGLSFEPVSGAKSTNVMLNPDGSYSGEAVVGANVVVVFASAGPDGGHVDAEKSGVKTVYMDTKSPLKADVKEGQENKCDFDVGKDPSGG